MKLSACDTTSVRAPTPRCPERVIALVVLIVATLAVAALLGPAAIRFLSLTRHAYRLRAITASASTDLIREESRQSLMHELRGVERDLIGLRADLRWFLALAPSLEKVPYLGGTLASVPHFLDMGNAVCAGGIAVLQGIEGFDSILESSSSDEDAMAKITRFLVASRADFTTAEQEIERAMEARARFSEAQLIPPLVDPMQRLDRLLPLARGALQLAQVAPDLLGATAPRAYLVVAQNNDELRATGGFISGIGLAVIQEGKLVKLDFQDSYAVENWDQPHPDPPESLRKYMMADLWVTRDANWWPDFPTSAQALQDLYELNQGIRTDGVIAVDLKGLEYIVHALEPLSLGKDEEQVTAANVKQKIREIWAPPPDLGPIPTDPQEWTPEVRRWFAHRKDFMPLLSAAMLAKLQNPNSVDWAKLLWFLKRALEEKHLLLYFNDPVCQSVLASNGWDGTLSSAPGDYLMVADSNVGFNKVNPNIEQSISYEVKIDPHGRLLGAVVLEYHSKVTRELPECLRTPRYDENYDLMTQRCYWDYVRIYVPLGSELVSASGGAEFEPPAEECGKTLFSAFFVLAPRETKRIVFEYTLPPDIVLHGEEVDHYRLTVQKQPGTLSPPLRIGISIPSDRKIVAVDPPPSEQTASHLDYDLRLQKDVALELKWK